MAPPRAFAKVPDGVRSMPTPMQIHHTEAALTELRDCIRLSRVAVPTYENAVERNGEFGLSRDWLAHARDIALKQDKASRANPTRRAVETHVNTFPQYRLGVVDDDGRNYDIHFAALFSAKPDAVPIINHHGWPGSFFEFLPIMSLLAERYTPETLPYHFIAPSLPGFAYSSQPPVDINFQIEDVARIMTKFTTELGLKNYIATGGDIGSRVARVQGVLDPACIGVHLNFCLMFKPDTNIHKLPEEDEWEKAGAERRLDFQKTGCGYALMHATRPGTIGLILAASPLALLSWIGEKFVAWTDEPLPLRTILDHITLYWLTETFPHSIYTYRQDFDESSVAWHGAPSQHLHKPLAYSDFAKEITPIPRSWVATTGDLVFYRRHAKGGHFAALERPGDLLQDWEEFVAKVTDRNE